MNKNHLIKILLDPNDREDEKDDAVMDLGEINDDEKRFQQEIKLGID